MKKDYWDEPAFPASSSSIPDSQKGLTKREYFAALFVPGIQSALLSEFGAKKLLEWSKHLNSVSAAETISRLAIGQMDSLITHLEGKRNGQDND